MSARGCARGSEIQPRRGPADNAGMRNTLLALVLALGLVLAAAATTAAERDDGVVLYYAEWCGYCAKAQAWLDANDIAYEKRNVDEPKYNKELVDVTGRTAIPVLKIGEELIRGFRESDYEKKLSN